MQQISFTVSNLEMAHKVLSSLGELTEISNIQVKQLEDAEFEQIIPATKTAESIEELLLDWTDMQESTEDFRKKLWETKSF